jgi:Uma2 family endonuclease
MQQRPPHRTLTAEDLYALRDDGRVQELVAGVAVTEPAPGGEHGRVEAQVVMLLKAFVRRNGRGRVYAGDTGFILARAPDTVRGPDVAFVSRERLQSIGEGPGYLPGAPDLAVEILSPGDRPGDVRAKVADYLAAGTRRVWVIDPDAQCVRIYRSLLDSRLLESTEELDGEDVLPGFRVEVAELFED